MAFLRSGALSKFLILSVTFFGLSAAGQVADVNEITFGPEFEFSHPRMHRFSNFWGFLRSGYNYPGPNEQAEILRFVAVVNRKCEAAGCRVEQVPGKYDRTGAFTYRVTFADGWFFEITPDAWCVEVTAKPQTLNEARSRQALMDHMIFQTAREIGLHPQGTNFFGGLMGKAAGHMNFGTRAAFGDSGRAWLRYFVDYANMPELARGALQADIINAPAFSTLGRGPRAALQRIVNELNRGEDWPIQRVAKRVIDRVYTTSPVMRAEAEHYQAMGVKHAARLPVDGDRPTEHRAMPSQNNAGEFIALAELIAHRVNFLRAQGDRPIVLLDVKGGGFSPVELVSRFYVYVEEMGLDFGKYKHLLQPELRSVAPDSFVLGQLQAGREMRQRVVTAMHHHLPHVATSPLIQARVIEALRMPVYATEVADVAGRILELSRTSPTAEERELYRRYLDRLRVEVPSLRDFALTDRRERPSVGLALPRCEAVFIH